MSVSLTVSLGPIEVTYGRFASERICWPERLAWIPSIALNCCFTAAADTPSPRSFL